MHASEQDRVDARQDEEDGQRRQEREELRALAKAPDEERLDPTGYPADHEVDRDFREEHTESEHAQNERHEETRAARERPRREPIPRQPTDERPGSGTPLGHARRTPRRSHEPMPQVETHDQFFI